MKYLILVPDGSADRPGEGDEKTPMEAAFMPHINGLAARGEVGSVKTIPDGISPGSDAANLAVMGYDPLCDLTGRSPLEAVSMGIELAPDDVSFRVNLVTLRGDADAAYEDLRIVDHSAGDITTDEARILVEQVDRELGSGNRENDGRVAFYPGFCYRNALIVRDGPPTSSGVGDVSKDADGYDLTPPHDIPERRIGDYLPKGEGSDFILRLMNASYGILKDHPVNRERERRGLNVANSIWIWGQGKKPALESFRSKFGIDGSVISAVDLIKGIGICAGLESVSVDGVTGALDTNFRGKAEKAIEAFERGKDFVYVHVEAPDECSHQGDRAGKIKALELIDKDVMGPILAYLEGSGEDYRILVVPDHRTPLAIRTHSEEPAPFVLFDSARAANAPVDERKVFSERSGEGGRYFDSGKALATYFFGKSDD
ncbi:MAG: cofactor-independent phosphoglycerate mutase [Clostridiales Family XIII bacterium]|nr:cofactor-independent phosphoglycerate mutase [Clostridiales Family XIII bacterium]